MKCPKCSAKMNVYCIRAGRPTVRYRKCKKCGYTEKTVES
jgi:Zn ribbon nucleic-acid-binding protein